MEESFEEDYDLFGQAFEQNQLKKGVQTFNSRIKKYRKNTVSPIGIRERLDCISAYIFHGRFMLLLGKNQRAEKSLTELEVNHGSFLEGYPRLRAEYLHNVGELAFCDGEYSKCVELTQEALKIKKQAKTFASEDWQKISVGQSLIVLGKGYWKKGDFQTALLSYYEAFMNYQEAFHNRKYYLVGRALTLIAEVFFSQERFEKAEELLEKAIELLSKLPNQNHFYLGGVKSFLAECLYKNSNPINDERIECLLDEAEKALSHSFANDPHRYTAKLLSVKTNWQLKKLKTVESAADITNLFEPELEVRRNLDGVGRIKIGVTYQQICDHLYNHGYYDEAIEAAEQAIIQLMPDVARHDQVFSEKELEEAKGLNYLMQSLFLKAKALYKIYLNSPTKYFGHLEEARIHLQSANNVIRKIRYEISANDAKLELSKDVRSVYELYIEIGYEMLKMYEGEDPQKTVALKEELFKLLQDCNSSLLLEAILSPQAQRISNRLYGANQPNMDSILARVEEKLLNPDLILTREEYQQLEDHIHSRREAINKYNKFIRCEINEINRKTETFTLKNFQNEFYEEEERGVAIYYFLNPEKGIYTFLITRDSFHIHLLPYGELKRFEELKKAVEEIMKFLNSNYLYDKTRLDPGIDFDKCAFLFRARKVYNVLFHPLTLNSVPDCNGESNSIIKENDRIYFIGDQFLGQFPFDLLITEDEKNYVFKPYREAPFLIKKHKIAYHASISALFMIYKSSKEQGTLAPPIAEIKNSAHVVGTEISDTIAKPVSYMEKIVSACQQELLKAEHKTDIKLLEAQDTEQELESIRHYDLIHIIAHSTKTPRDPSERPAIILCYDSNKNEEFLLTPEQIVNVKFQTELVMLTTCRSGAGISSPGESPINLSNAFIMANVRNVYFTFFDIYIVHAEMMATAFLRGLRSGLNYVTAMQEAKLELINSDKFSEPQCWAAVAFMGNQVAKVNFTE